MNADLDYFRRRVAVETAAATAAIDPAARRAHLELARRYQERCAGIEIEQRFGPAPDSKLGKSEATSASPHRRQSLTNKVNIPATTSLQRT